MVKNCENWVNFSKYKRRKVGALGTISSYDKTSFYLYYENFNNGTCIKILEEAIHEMRDFNTEEKSQCKWIMQDIIRQTRRYSFTKIITSR